MHACIRRRRVGSTETVVASRESAQHYSIPRIHVEYSKYEFREPGFRSVGTVQYSSVLSKIILNKKKISPIYFILATYTLN